MPKIPKEKKLVILHVAVKREFREKLIAFAQSDHRRLADVMRWALEEFSEKHITKKGASSDAR